MIHRFVLFVLLCLPFSAVSAADSAGGKIRVLLLGGQNNHDWRKGSDFHLALLAGQPGIVAEESNTPAEKSLKTAWDEWNPDFARYDVVLLNYNGEMWPDKVKASFSCEVGSECVCWDGLDLGQGGPCLELIPKAEVQGRAVAVA